MYLCILCIIYIYMIYIISYIYIYMSIYVYVSYAYDISYASRSRSLLYNNERMGLVVEDPTAPQSISWRSSPETLVGIHFTCELGITKTYSGDNKLQRLAKDLQLCHSVSFTHNIQTYTSMIIYVEYMYPIWYFFWDLCFLICRCLECHILLLGSFRDLDL